MATPIKMARVSKVAAGAEVVEWLKTSGAEVREGEPVVRVLSEKATIDLEAPASGVFLGAIVAAGREVPAGTVLGWIGQAGEVPPAAEAAPMPQTPIAPAQSARPAGAAAPRAQQPASGAARAVPAARRAARERGMDLGQVAGSGPGGVITLSDVAMWQAPSGRPAAPSSAPALAEGERLAPLSGIQRVMLERMTQNNAEVAQATTVAEVDVTEVMSLRGVVPATLTAWVILAASRALGEYPLLNAALRGREIVYHGAVHAGVSVETDAGLLAPVIREAQRKSLGQMNAELTRLTQAAREGRLTAEEMAGATFTVTNSGVLGSVLYTPMIVLPQSAILGMGRAAKMPTVRDDQVVIRTLMYLCLSYDHRFIPGGTAVRCLQRIRAFLEAPATLVWDA